LSHGPKIDCIPGWPEGRGFDAVDAGDGVAEEAEDGTPTQDFWQGERGPGSLDGIVGEGTGEGWHRPTEEAERAAVDDADAHQKFKPEPGTEGEVKQAAKDAVQDEIAAAPAHDGQDPEAGDADMREGLKGAPQEAFLDEAPPAKIGEGLESFVVAIKAIDHYAEQDQAERAFDHAGGCCAFEHAEAHGEADSKEEMRHDRVGITVVGVVMFEYIVDGLEATDEIDEKHSNYGVAAELIEGEDAG